MTPSLRILLVVADHRPTGTALVAMRHARGLRMKGAEVFLIGQSGKKLEEVCRAENFWADHSLILDRRGKPWNFLGDILRLRHLVKNLAIQAVIAYGSNEQLIASFALRRLGVPLIRFANGSPGGLALGAGPRQDFRRGKGLILRYGGASGLLAADPATLTYTPELVRSGRAAFVPAGVSPEEFHPLAPGRQRWRDMLGVQPDEVLCGMLAAYKPERGFALFIRAFAEAARTRPHLRAVLAGDGSAEITAAFRAIADRHQISSRVVFHRPTGDLPGFWAALDVGFICHPGTGGGGSALLEGMAAETAMIAGDQGPLHLLAGHGTYARVISKPSPVDLDLGPVAEVSPAQAELSAALALLADDAALRATLAEAGRQAVCQQFSTQRMAETILGVIQACGIGSSADASTPAS